MSGGSSRLNYPMMRAGIAGARQPVSNCAGPPAMAGRQTSNCRRPASTLEIKMIKISVFYPNNDGSKFDMDYYCRSHIPMVQQKLGAACKGVAVEQGLGGAMPGSRPVYIAMGHLYFDSVEASQAAFVPHAQTFMADVPNFTNIQPVIQVSEVKI
jgi:uncharacterized protein (TIGR02118 family)